MKQCPFCNKENPKSISTCSCGYVFDNEKYEKNQTMEISEGSLTGRKIVVFIIIATIVVSIYAIILNSVVLGPNKIPQHVIRFILTLILSYFLFKGANSARIIASILYSLAAIGGIIAGVLFLVKSLPIGLMILSPGIVHTICAFFLIFSSPVKHFFKESEKI